MGRNIITSAFLLLGLAGASAGCSRAQVLCDLECSCEHCNDQDEVLKCDSYETQSDVSSAYDCGDAFDELSVCIEEKGQCDATEARFSTQDDQGMDRCDTQRTNLAECINKASAHNGNGNNF